MRCLLIVLLGDLNAWVGSRKKRMMYRGRYADHMVLDNVMTLVRNSLLSGKE